MITEITKVSGNAIAGKFKVKNLKSHPTPFEKSKNFFSDLGLSFLYYSNGEK